MDEFQLNLFFTRSKKNNYFNIQSSMNIYFKSNRLYKNVYKGTFAMDEFSHIDMFRSDKCLIVFNSITRNTHTMGHWLLLYSERLSDGMLHVTFFDSFGLSISHYNPILINYLNRHSSHIKNLDFNTFPLQANNSYVCGAYVCFIAEKLVSGQHLKQICKNFFKKNDRKFNDTVVTRFIKSKWYRNSCTTEFCPMKSYAGECFNCKCCESVNFMTRYV